MTILITVTVQGQGTSWQLPSIKQAIISNKDEDEDGPAPRWWWIGNHEQGDDECKHRSAAGDLSVIVQLYSVVLLLSNFEDVWLSISKHCCWNDHAQLTAAVITANIFSMCVLHWRLLAIFFAAQWTICYCLNSQVCAFSLSFQSTSLAICSHGVSSMPHCKLV